MTKKKATKEELVVVEAKYSANGYRGPGRFANVRLISASLTSKQKLKVQYHESNDLGHQEYSVKLDHTAHEDLVNAFDALGYDLLMACEQPEAMMFDADDFTTPEGLAVFHVDFQGQSLRGEKVSKQVTGYTLPLNTPSLQDTYVRYENVNALLRKLDEEVKCYLNGKQRAEQAELFDEDNN